MTVGRDWTRNLQGAFREKPRPWHRRARARESWGDGGDRIRAFAPNPPPPSVPGGGERGGWRAARIPGIIPPFGTKEEIG